ncbi:collagenase [Chloroflexus sp.]|uniref:collagenase n=1 Tax=Chloroflexus sp. TaxID=1904827 RepID=UPI00298EFB32|nr:collagenase [Chloroflexus sp.]MDW8404093.1 collagenase [Chloroflexus sp.]
MKNPLIALRRRAASQVIRMRHLFVVLIMIILLVPSGSRLPLAVAPANPPSIRVPACPQPTYPDATAMLAVLPQANYDCTEQIAAALRPRVEPEHVAALLSIAGDSSFDARTRRNALRILGRLAESGRATRAGDLMAQMRTATESAAIALIERERDNFLLQDAVWLLDGIYYPSWAATSALEQVALATGYAPALRYRAARARARLIAAERGPLSDDARRFIATALASADPGVRTAAAEAISFLRDDQLGERAYWQQLVETALAAEPPLQVAADSGDPRGAALLTFLESTPTALTARAALARAADRLAGEWASAPRLNALRQAYEQLALPVAVSTPTVTLHAGPAGVADAAALTAVVANAYAQARRLLGPVGETPIPGEEQVPLRVLIFPSQASYRDYMRAFTPFTVDVDGIYDVQQNTLYSYRRGEGQTANTLEETLRHETAHAVTAAYLFPGYWLSPGYHAEPKGWFDEGFAEVLTAQAQPEGPLQPHRRHLETICALPLKPALADLVARRDGYDQYGSFDYPAAWALMHFLLVERPAAAAAFSSAWRSQTYRFVDWPRLGGWPDWATAEADWHAAIARWCQ